MDELVSEIVTLHRFVLGADQAAKDARHERDEAIRKAVAGGVTAYSLAKLIGMTDSGVQKIVNGGKC